jgi:hypothetical protein
MATKPPNASEINGWLKDAKLSELVGDATFADYLSGVITRQMLAQSDALYEQMRKAMTGTPSPRALDRARNLANQQADRLARDMTRAELNKMGAVIADGIAKGQGTREIARSLDMVKGLDQNHAKSYTKYRDYLDTLDIDEATYNARLERKFQQLLRDRKETIAQAEERKAVSGAEYEEEQAHGAKEHCWMTAGDGRVREEHAANEAQGWIPIDAAFQDGEKFPGQPNCRCTIGYRKIATPQSDARAKQRAERTAAAIAAANEEAKSISREDSTKPQEATAATAATADSTEKAKTWEAEHSDDDIESAAIYTSDGELLVEQSGDRDKVDFSGKDLAAARNGVLTHNHPDQVLPDGTKILGGPFSPKDLAFSASNELKEIRVRDSRYEYSAVIPKTETSTPERRGRWIQNMLDVSKKLEKDMEEGIRSDIKKGRPAQAVATKWTHWRMNQLSEKCNFTYTRKRV